MMNRRTSWIVGCMPLLWALAAPCSHAQYVLPNHWGIGIGYFSDRCVGCGGFGCINPGCCEVGFYGATPIGFPPPIVVDVPIGVPAPIVLPPVAAIGVGDAPWRPPHAVAPPQGVEPHDPAAEIRRRAEVLKASTPAGRGRADRLISSGDTAFAEQVYARSTARYREAIARAPDYSEPHFRLAHAYVATRQYNLALNSALVALELAGSSRRDGFSLAEMYRGNKFSRRKHDDQLLDAALREPEDGGLQFLIGLTLHYGGNPLKAREHFRQAARLSGPQQTYVRHFLPVVAVGEPLPAVAAAK